MHICVSFAENMVEDYPLKFGQEPQFLTVWTSGLKAKRSGKVKRKRKAYSGLLQKSAFGVFRADGQVADLHRRSAGADQRRFLRGRNTVLRSDHRECGANG